jgi:AraC family transcriptional activator of pyochelin receptor
MSLTELKNNAEPKWEALMDQGLYLLRLGYEDGEVHQLVLQNSDIHLLFALDGDVMMQFGPMYGRPLTSGNQLLYYNPEKAVTVQLQFPPQGRLLVIRSTMSKLHSLFLVDTPELSFLSSENASRKFYEETAMEPRLMVPLNQLYSLQIRSHAHKVICRGKVYEIMGLYFSAQQEDAQEACPFLKDEDNMRKIKRAKDFLISKMANPPTIRELSREVGLNEFRLKSGFREVYGNTVFGFLLDYKLEKSRVMLESDQYKINEVAYALGYTNPSHYIAAFKKKYGLTPKKYLSNK